MTAAAPPWLQMVVGVALAGLYGLAVSYLGKRFHWSNEEIAMTLFGALMLGAFLVVAWKWYVSKPGESTSPDDA